MCSDCLLQSSSRLDTLHWQNMMLKYASVLSLVQEACERVACSKWRLPKFGGVCATLHGFLQDIKHTDACEPPMLACKNFKHLSHVCIIMNAIELEVPARQS